MYQWKKKGYNLILSLLLLFSTASFGYAAESEKLPKINIAPSSDQVSVGDMFEVAIWLQGFMEEYSGIEGFQIRLKYDPTLIVPIVEENSQFKSDVIFSAASNPMTLANKIDTDGTIEFAQSLTSPNDPNRFTGYGKLGTLTFKSLKEGNATFTLEKSIIIMPGNAGVNIKHANYIPTIVIGNGNKVEAKLETVGDEPKTAKTQRSIDEILQGFKDYQAFSTLDWAKEGVAKLADRKIVNGTPDGNFNPKRNMTRAEFAKVVVIGLGLDMKQKASPSFVDISKTDWFYDYVETAADYGLIKGTEKDGKRYFKPQDSISRAEIAAILSRALVNLKGHSNEQISINPFTDVKDDFWGRNEVLHLYSVGVIKGKSASSFAPLDSASRAEISVMLSRMLD